MLDLLAVFGLIVVGWIGGYCHGRAVKEELALRLVERQEARNTQHVTRNPAPVGRDALYGLPDVGARSIPRYPTGWPGLPGVRVLVLVWDPTNQTYTVRNEHER